MNNEQILNKVKQYQEVVKTKNKALFDDLWSNEGECVLISIVTEFIGKENIYNQFFVEGLGSYYEKIELITEKMEIRFYGDDLAVVVFGYHTDCLRKETLEPYSIQGLETQIYRKENGDYKLFHVHYSK